MTADLIRDAAEPLDAALRAVRDAGLDVPQVDITVAFVTGGCVVRIADRSTVHREVVEEHVVRAFDAAGWGWAVRGLDGIRLQHPSRVTRL